MCSAGWHSQPGPLFGGDGWASYGSQMRAVGAAVAPQFKRANWWYVMQGSVIDSAADHNHWCNATHWRDDSHKCWSAGWRLCAQPEVRLQIWSVLLSGVRGIMFYRLGLGGWQQPSNNIDAPLNRSWVAGVLLPALAEMAPHLPAILSGPLRGSGALLPRTNVSEVLVSSRLYNCPAASDCHALLVALAWPTAAATHAPTSVRFELGSGQSEGVAVRLDERGKAETSFKLSDGAFADVLARPGAVNVYHIKTTDESAQTSRASRSVLVWMFTDFYTTDAELDARIASLAAAAAKRAITTVSPTTHTLAPDGTLQERALQPNVTTTRSAAALFNRLRSAGLEVLPTIFNNEAGQSSLPPKMDKLFANPKPFIDAALGLCSAHNLSGVNVDFETGKGTVSAEQAQAFAGWAGGRLPSESEWEYAARSGGKAQTYPWGDEEATCSLAVMEDGGKGCGEERTWPVCSKPAGNSRQGVCDLAGNVWEWVQDGYHDTYSGAPEDGTAWDEDGAAYRVIRGGSWYSTASVLRASNRNGYVPSDRNSNLGFRLAR